jgi:hypothetical protein
MPALMIHPRTGQPIPKDYSVFEILLCCHGDTKGGAWKLSIGPDPLAGAPPQRGGLFFMPQAWVDRSEALGGFQRMDERCQRKLVTVHEFSMAKFHAVLKGLAE